MHEHHTEVARDELKQRRRFTFHSFVEQVLARDQRLTYCTLGELIYRCVATNLVTERSQRNMRKTIRRDVPINIEVIINVIGVIVCCGLIRMRCTSIFIPSVIVIIIG